MINIASELQKFWGGFGLPAFVEGAVPDTFPDEDGKDQPVTLPYITYRLVEPNWNETVQEYVRIWYRSTSFTGVIQKADEIKRAIGNGITIPFDGGFIAMMPDINFCQYMLDDDPNIKTAYISLIMHAMEV